MLASVHSALNALHSPLKLTELAKKWTESLDPRPKSSVQWTASQFSLLEPLWRVRANLLAHAARRFPANHNLNNNAKITMENVTAGDLAALHLLRMAARARARGISSGAQQSESLQLGLRWLREAESLPGLTRGVLLRTRWLQARCFWDLGETRRAVSIARCIADECRVLARQLPSSGQQVDEDWVKWMAKCLSKTGEWLSDSSLETAPVVKDQYLSKAVELAQRISDPGPRLRLAHFLDQKLRHAIDNALSLEETVAQKLRQRNRQELKSLENEIRRLPANSNELAATKSRAKQLQRQIAQDDHAEKQKMDLQKDVTLQLCSQLGACLCHRYVD